MTRQERAALIAEAEANLNRLHDDRDPEQAINASLARQRAQWERDKNAANAAIDGPIGRMGGRVPRHDI